MTHHFHTKVYQKLIIYLILCSLWIVKLARTVYGWGKRPKHVCQSLTLNFYCLFTLNFVSFHASSRLILHADVSYIIDIACHWSYFSNITSFSYFLDRQNPDFFSIFQLQIFAEPVPVELMFTHSTVITGLKHAISPYFGIVWVLFYNI